ncbi:MAG TPA: radical SAM protein, partial [Sulfurospirillum sp. UBA11407]
MLDEQMQNRDAFQGDFFTFKTPVEELDDIVTCKDGSLSFWDKKYKDYYHPKAGAIFQAQKLFIECSKLANKLTCKDVNLLDIGFG